MVLIFGSESNPTLKLIKFFDTARADRRSLGTITDIDRNLLRIRTTLARPLLLTFINHLSATISQSILWGVQCIRFKQLIRD